MYIFREQRDRTDIFKTNAQQNKTNLQNTEDSDSQWIQDQKKLSFPQL